LTEFRNDFSPLGTNAGAKLNTTDLLADIGGTFHLAAARRANFAIPRDFPIARYSIRMLRAMRRGYFQNECARLSRFEP
jgi:hypothetical protein